MIFSVKSNLWGDIGVKYPFSHSVVITQPFKLVRYTHIYTLRTPRALPQVQMIVASLLKPRRKECVRSAELFVYLSQSESIAKVMRGKNRDTCQANFERIERNEERFCDARDTICIYIYICRRL